MSHTSAHPAVFAGLMGGASWGVPTWAFAISLDQAASVASNSLVAQFLLGCMTGGALASAAIGVASLASRHRERTAMEDADGPATTGEEETPAVFAADEDLWSSSSLSLLHAQLRAEEQDTTGSLGRTRTGQISLDASDRERDLSQAHMQPDAPRRARHTAVDPTNALALATTRPVGRHFAPRAVEDASQAPRPKHAAPRVAVPQAPARKHAAPQPAQPQPVADVSPAAVQDVVSADLPRVATPALGAAARASLADLPTIDSRRMILEAATTNVLPRSHGIGQVIPASKLEASTYTLAPDNPYLVADNRNTLRTRLAQRTKNVCEVLAERLNPEAMESIPQIQRADGSVEQIEPTWFDKSVVPALASFASKFEDMDEIESTAPHDVDTFENKMQISAAPTVLMRSDAFETIPMSAEVTRPLADRRGESRASYISTRIAAVDLGMFPERRAAEDLEHEDVFEQALAAMGENIRREAPVFEDMVGGPSTIDDPDGLEGPTTLIPFRARANRINVVDTETYVDYLIDDELSRGNRDSGRMRRHPKHAYLRVIEGGTSPFLMRQRADSSGYLVASHGRHFAEDRRVAGE